jgi:transcriptional regulator with XRE-family HTH domain
MKTFADWFLARRLELDQTQEEVAAILNVSCPSIWRWESGAFPQAPKLAKVAKWGNITSDKLLQLLEKSADSEDRPKKKKQRRRLSRPGPASKQAASKKKKKATKKKRKSRPVSRR